MNRPALATIVALVSSGTLVAQSLADAAKRADAQRRENAHPSITLREPMEREDESLPPLLTFERVNHYFRARAALNERRAADFALNKRLLAATKGIQQYIDLADIFAADPVVANVFDAQRMSPRTYVRTEILLLVLQKRYALPFDQWPIPRTERLKENFAFYKQNYDSIDRALADAQMHEGNLRLWGGLAPKLPEVVP